MVNNSMDYLDSISKEIFQKSKVQQNQNFLLWSGDNVLDKLQELYLSVVRAASSFKGAAQHVFPEPEFTPIIPQENGRTPLLFTDYGEVRVSPELLLSGILGSARVQMLLDRVFPRATSVLEALLPWNLSHTV